jgi:glutaredoxin-like protein
LSKKEIDMLNDDVKKEVKKQFETLEHDVKLIIFTQKVECNYCADNRTLALDVAELSDKITARVFDLEDDKQAAEKYGIDKIPAIAVVSEEDYGIRFFGIPAGYEFSSLLEAIKLVSTGKPELAADTTNFLDNLQKDVHLQVFVTPTCPYCPGAVILAHRLARHSKRVKADMVEISEFPHLGNKYGVQGVPRTVINEHVSQEGAAPEQMLLEKIKSAVS